jgi:hypothetical protein
MPAVLNNWSETEPQLATQLRHLRAAMRVTLFIPRAISLVCINVSQACFDEETSTIYFFSIPVDPLPTKTMGKGQG